MLIAIIIFIVASNLEAKGEDVLSLSHEIRARIEPPEEPQPQQHPIITSSSSRQHLQIGSVVVFPCKVNNLGSHVLVWKRGPTHVLFSGSLKIDSDISLSLLEDKSLKISSVRPEHAGSYSCSVASSQPMELTHFLEVLVPPKVTPEPSDGHVIAKKDDSVTLKCHAEGHPPPQITWSTTEGTLPRGIPEKQGSTLTIPSVDTYHSKQYQCKASNGIGDPVTALFRVKVYYSPEVKVKPAWVHAGLGSAVEFTCTVSAEPPAPVRWTRSDGLLLHEDTHVSIHTMGPSTTRVKIKRITEEYFGSYNCSAKNSLGSSYEVVEVSGLAEPVSFRNNSPGEDGTSFLLLWTVKSYSSIIEYMLRVRKKEDGVDDTPGPWIDVMIPVEIQQSVLHSHSYNVTGLQPGTAYEAVIQARNDFGWNHPSDSFIFHTSGKGQSEGIMEEQPLEPTTLLSPITDYQEEVVKKNNLEMEVVKSDNAGNHRVADYFIAVLMFLLACAIH